MTRRGRCRCGTILLFRMTSQGYKMRCPDCRAVVRLRVDAPKASAPVAVQTLPPPLPPLPVVPRVAVPRLVEMEPYRDPFQDSGFAWPWLLLAGIALGVMVLFAAVVALGS